MGRTVEKEASEYWDAHHHVAEDGSSYDAVFFHQSLHHVRSIEKLLVRVERALARDGLLFLDEWTGPSRREWTNERLAKLRRIYADLPQEWRRFPILQKPLEINDL